MSEVSPIIESISGKIDQLKDKIEVLKAEKATLEKSIGTLSAKLEESQASIISLTEENGKLRVAGSMSGSGEGVTETKLKINELVKEIDKCIALLNG